MLCAEDDFNNTLHLFGWLDNKAEVEVAFGCLQVPCMSCSQVQFFKQEFE